MRSNDHSSARSKRTGAVFSLAVFLLPSGALAQSSPGGRGPSTGDGTSGVAQGSSGTSANGASAATPSPGPDTNELNDRFEPKAKAGTVANGTNAGPTPGTAEPTKADDKKDAKKDEPSGKFEFGSYGRVRAVSDLRGGTGRGANIVSFGPRTDEESYAEIELRREDTWKDGIKTRIVTTLALLPPFFHFSGKMTQAIALRNLYAQGTIDRYTLWVGSRMYRGDDIYLLNWWPLDNQNTVGGGVGIKFDKERGDTMLALHAGMQRLDDPFQTQSVAAVAPYGFGSTQVIKVDRPRTIETAKLIHFFRNSPDKTLFPGNDAMGFKAVVYGEAHQLAAGVQRDPLTDRDRALPADTGFLAGVQLGYWTGVRDGFVHVFAKHARGIAAYDPLAVPTTFANDRTTSGASDTIIATGGNLETEAVGVQWGAYLRFFRDASEGATSREKYDEGAVVVRPNIFISDHFGVAVEGSYQQRRYALADADGESKLTTGLFRAGVIPYFSPAGRGSFKRPQLRILYMATARDKGARSLYPKEDVFSQRSVEHFFGLGAEWWFNSSSYP